MESNDINAIKSATEELSNVVQQLSVKLYQQAGAQQGAAGAAGAEGAAKGKDNVVDADYEVVDDKK